MNVLSRRWWLAAVVVAAAVVAWRSLPALSYGPGGPTALGRFFAWLWSRYSMLGLPPRWQQALEVRGRRSGEPRILPLVLASRDDTDYLVSMFGERTGAERPGSRRRGCPVRLVEVPAEERAPIIEAYLSRAIGGRPHIPVWHDAPVAEFERVAPDIPVFRIEDQ